jgi:hypothetical protein
MRKNNALAFAIVLAGFIIPAAAQIDTTGISDWKPMFNSMASWEEGAFGANAGEHPDYGWGVYNMIHHSVIGDSIFVIKLPDESYKRLWIVERDGSSVYTIRHASLDGSNEQEVVIDMKGYADKQFVYYNLRGDSLVDEQPAAADWDLMLTKYSHTGLGGYPVTGFLSNDGVTVSVFNAPDSSTAADATLADTTEFTDSITAIGDSWSTLEGYSIIPLDTIVYFIKTDTGTIHQMQVTFFESGYSGLGRIGIRRKHSDSTAWVHDTLVMGAFYADEVYYRMDTGTVASVPRDVWDIGFKSGVYTSSITANTTMGVELYTYPLADTSAWRPSTSTGPVISDGEEIRFYPVPANDHLFVQHGLTSAVSHVRIFDMTGRQVLEQKTETWEGLDLRLDISSLAPGVYILQMDNPETKVSGRFTKRR